MKLLEHAPIRLPDRFNPQIIGQQLASPFMGLATRATPVIENITSQAQTILNPHLTQMGEFYKRGRKYVKQAPQRAVRNFALAIAPHEPLKSQVVPRIIDHAYDPHLDKDSKANIDSALEVGTQDPETIYMVASLHSNHGDHGANSNLINHLSKEIKKILRHSAIKDHTATLAIAAKYVWEENPKFRIIFERLGPIFDIIPASVIQPYLVHQRRYTVDEARKVNAKMAQDLRGLLNKKRLGFVLVYPEGTREELDGQMRSGKKGLENIISMIIKSAPVVILPTYPEFKQGYERDGLNLGMLNTLKVGQPIYVPKDSTKIPTTDEVMMHLANLKLPGKRGIYENAA